MLFDERRDRRVATFDGSRGFQPTVRSHHEFFRRVATVEDSRGNFNFKRRYATPLFLVTPSVGQNPRLPSYHRYVMRFQRRPLNKARASTSHIVLFTEAMIEPEDNLVRTAQRGDKAAFEELVRRTTRLVFARLYLETGDTHQAEDLLQETFLTAYRNLGQLTEPAKFRSWLLRIAQNRAIDASRRRQRQKQQLDILRLEASPTSVHDGRQEDLRQQVLAVLRALPEEYRLPLTLRYLAGADYETIQMEMGLTNGSLRGCCIGE